MAKNKTNSAFDLGIPIPFSKGRNPGVQRPWTMAAQSCPVGGSFLVPKTSRFSVYLKVQMRGLAITCRSVDEKTYRVWVIERPTENGSKK